MPHPPSALWKLTIDPRGKTDPEADSFRFCRDRGIVGVGWAFDRRPASREDALVACRRMHGRLSAALNIMVSRARVGDHFWLYGERSHFVCEVRSDWQYAAGAGWDEHDIHNFRKAQWKRVPAALVPGIVQRKLTMYGTAQLITESVTWCRYSAYLFGRDLVKVRSGARDLTMPRLRKRLREVAAKDVLEVLDPGETEDIVGLLLQVRYGWRLLKSTAYPTNPDVECTFRRMTRGGPSTAYMQVKSGTGVPLDASAFVGILADGDVEVYLFSSADLPYSGPAPDDRIHQLGQNEVVGFLIENLELMAPATVLRLAIWRGSVERGESTCRRHLGW